MLPYIAAPWILWILKWPYLGASQVGMFPPGRGPSPPGPPLPATARRRAGAAPRHPGPREARRRRAWHGPGPLGAGPGMAGLMSSED